MRNIRIGFGYDVHRLSGGLPLWIGGVEIEHSKGAVAHSDGDVLIHAICDAMLGALALGDIGTHFPDTDDMYKGIDSKILLSKTLDKIKTKGYVVGNIDSMLCLERPKIKGYIDDMKVVLSSILEINTDDVSVKATTKEKLGFVGNEEGVEASAVVILFREGM